MPSLVFNAAHAGKIVSFTGHWIPTITLYPSEQNNNNKTKIMQILAMFSVLLYFVAVKRWSFAEKGNNRENY